MAKRLGGRYISDGNGKRKLDSFTKNLDDGAPGRVKRVIGAAEDDREDNRLELPARPAAGAIADAPPEAPPAPPPAPGVAKK